MTEGKVHGPREEFSDDMEQVKKFDYALSGLDYDLMLPGHGSPLKPDAAIRVGEFSGNNPLNDELKIF